MKKKNKIVKIIAILVLIILVIGTGLYIKRRNNYIYITQFSPTTSRQMMGYAIKTLNGKIVVIDGGLQEDAQQLEKYITDNGGEVDTWFITHPHIDHAGAFEIISQNTSIKIDNITAKILGTKNPEITTNAINNSSMVIQIQVNQKKILFLGDTGTESSEKLIKNQGKNLKSDIVQVAHHGQAGATEELYKIVNPKICLWPTIDWLWDNIADGKKNAGPFKTMETRQWMENLKVKQNYLTQDGIKSIKIF